MEKITNLQIESALGDTLALQRDAHEFVPRGALLQKIEILAVFAAEVIEKVRKRFCDASGTLIPPSGPMKWIRYAGIGLWVLMRVIRLVRDLTARQE